MDDNFGERDMTKKQMQDELHTNESLSMETIIRYASKIHMELIATNSKYANQCYTGFREKRGRKVGKHKCNKKI